MSTSELLHKQLAKNKKMDLQLDLDDLHSDFDLENAVTSLFRQSFITNCHLDEASITGEELDTLDELSIEEVMENFNDLLNELLNFKRDYKASDKAELVQRSEQFENMLQKLEAEVRNHISIEHQLKLHIETGQNKTEELEKFRSEAEAKISAYEKKFEKNKNGKRDEKKDMALLKFEVECSKLKSLLEEKAKECEKLKKVIEKLKRPEAGSSSIEFLKKRLEEKASELGKIQQIMKEKADKSGVKYFERKHKRSHEDGHRNTPSPFRPRKETDATTWTDSRPSTAKRVPSRSHVRSNSDQVRPFSTKKLII